MSRFFEFKNLENKEFVVGAEYIIGLSPLEGEKTFGKGGRLIVKGGGKDGKNAIFKLNNKEAKSLKEQLLGK